ncbi:MAG: phenylalanine--tRNA ligase subunit alpha [Melioribacteraceae bacterium]|nr:phenylalanine--tRNA ligase subunit alpha [Melioribacteraceae bacterium]MCF8265699.1 phenylalanine--tRNA ligase subunit alpha [Melioribacteraceae bacterium]MCF8412803.1 phenylalanine--tRNA ligase subunit alpha [Melioribacteraceae bacterium]MCF8431704.1 phenylalanine--tRNA ligase subunit alpha [Melioribacteraceae bacterium]
MQNKIDDIQNHFEKELNLIENSDQLEEFRVKYLGRNGSISELFEEFKSLPKEEKPKYGKTLNVLKNKYQSLFDSKKEEISAKSTVSKSDIDFTLPGRERKLGRTHILTQTMFEIKAFFKNLGFSIHEGPELESDYYNFEALNFPADHPARDMQDTYFVADDFLMRTHTSPVQIRLMKNSKPPIRAIMPGKVYRNEAISAKSYCLFHQVEGLFVDTDVTFAELKGTLVAFAKHFYGKDVKYRFRASYFPFTEPSAEVDVWWQPKGKEGKWLEILGCGMVDPNVLENVGIDSEKYVGYAFGMGVERIALLRYGINDIRLFFDNDNRFLTQF